MLKIATKKHSKTEIKKMLRTIVLILFYYYLEVLKETNGLDHERNTISKYLKALTERVTQNDENGWEKKKNENNRLLYPDVSFTFLKQKENINHALTDTNVCESNSNGCDPTSTTCEAKPEDNTYVCVCKKGFEHIDDNDKKCKATNNCENNVCDTAISTCKLYDDADPNQGYYCECKEGYEHWNRNDKICREINFCESSKNMCDPDSTTCRPINLGYSCECKEGFERIDTISHKCQPINHCKNNKNECDTATTTCKLKDESKPNLGYSCECNEGFERIDGNIKKCQPINDCKNNKNECDTATTTCRLKDESKPNLGYYCECKEGLKYADGQNRRCIGIDLCKDGNNKCDKKNSICNLSDKKHSSIGYMCKCLQGFKKKSNTDDIQCIDIDECETGNHNCDLNNSKCVNIYGSFKCEKNETASDIRNTFSLSFLFFCSVLFLS